MFTLDLMPSKEQINVLNRSDTDDMLDLNKSEVSARVANPDEETLKRTATGSNRKSVLVKNSRMALNRALVDSTNGNSLRTYKNGNVMTNQLVL